MIIAIAYIARHNELYKQQGIYDALKEFDKKAMVDVLEDGTVRFHGIDSTRTILFKSGYPNLTKDFQNQLDSFLPSYFSTIEKISYQIAEIRIEGHTDTVCIERTPRDCYYYHIDLSQQRAFNVLKFVLESQAFDNLKDTAQNKLERLFVANGYGATKPLDSAGKYAYDSLSPINTDRSRRVDFKILLKSSIKK